MPRTIQQELEIEETIQGHLLTITYYGFPKNFNLYLLKLLRKNLIEGSSSVIFKSFLNIEHHQSEMKSTGKVYNTIISFNKEAYKNINKYRKNSRKIFTDTLKSYKKLLKKAPEYKNSLRKIKKVDKKLRLAMKNNSPKRQEISKLQDSYERERKSLEQEKVKELLFKKEPKFQPLRKKIVQFSLLIIDYLIDRKKKYNSRLVQFEESSKDKISLISKVKKILIKRHLNKIKAIISDVVRIRKLYNSDNNVFQISKEQNKILKIFSDWKKILKKGFQLNKKEKKKESQKIKLRYKKVRNELIESEINFSEAGEFQLKFNLNKVYYNLHIILAKYFQEKGISEEDFVFEEGYLKTKLTKEEVLKFHSEFKTIFKDSFEIKEFKNAIGIRLDFKPIFENHWNEFMRNTSPTILYKKPSKFPIKLNLHLTPQTKKVIRMGVYVGVIILVIIGFIFYNITFSKQIIVEKHDSVKIDYIIWESDSRKDYDVLNPLFDGRIWIMMIPVTENSTSGLILGLYNNLLNKEMHYESDLIWLDKCIDQNRDGIDDITNKTALTFGNSSDQYFNTCLMIKFKILDIEKISKSSLSPLLNPTVLLSITFFILGSVFGVIVLKKVIKKLRVRVRKSTRSYKSWFIKYGILFVSLVGLGFLTFYLMNSNIPLSHIDLIIEEYPYFWYYEIGFITLIYIVFSLLYLLVFSVIKSKIIKKQK